MGLIISRQKAYNLTVTRRKTVIFTLKKFRVLQISPFQLIFHGLVSRKISKLENQFPCSQKHILQTLQDLTTSLYLKIR